MPPGRSAAVDLNADLAEGAALSAVDRVLLEVVTSASIACGFHGGSAAARREAVAVCVERGTVVGAHVSYRDREGFGRRPLDVPPDRLLADLVEQWETLAADVDRAGGHLSYVKPHGALYHAVARDPAVAEVVIRAVRGRCPYLVAPTVGALADRVAGSGLHLVAEGFPDRGYGDDGRLLGRDRPDALVADPAEVGRRAVSLVVDGGVPAASGRWVSVAAETLCLHGDGPGADRVARAVARALDDAGIVRAPFAARPAPPAGAAP